MTQISLNCKKSEVWKTLPLKEVTEIFGGGTPSREQSEYFNGDIIWLTPTEIPRDKVTTVSDSKEKISESGLRRSSARIIPEGAVLLTSRATIGNVAIAGTEVTTNQGFASFVCKPGLNNHYLAYWFKANLDLLLDHAKGTTFKEISKSTLKELEISFPSVNEQELIVTKIEELFSQLDAATAALKRVQANLKRYKASVLKAACEGRLVPTEAELARREGRSYESGAELLERILKERRRRWEEEQRQKGKDPAKMTYPEPAMPDTDGLPELPEGWVLASLDQIGYLGRGKSKHRPRNSPDLFDGPYPFIQTGEIRHADGYITSFTNTYSEKGLQQSKLWPSGTLCITIAANIAETAILTFEACFPDSVVGYIPEYPIDVRFIEFFFRTAKENLERYAPATAQKNINLEILNNLAIPIPPIEEQRRVITEIEEKLSVAAQLHTMIEFDMKRIIQVKESILHKAFSGSLKEHQYPASSINLQGVN